MEEKNQMNEGTNKQLRQKIDHYLAMTNEEERQLLSNMIDGLTAKKEGTYRTYLAAMTQIKTRFLDNGDYEVLLPIQPLIENPLKMVHGGMTATLLDTAMGSLINQSISTEMAAVTAEMNIHYIKPGVGNYLRCVASLSHKGRQLCVAEAKVYDEKEKLVAMGTGTFFLIKRP